jgi:hypothetical protein
MKYAEIWHLEQINWSIKLNLSRNNKFLLIEPVSYMCLIIYTLSKYKMQAFRRFNLRYM